MASYIERHYPDQFKALGSRRKRSDIAEHVPDSMPIALMLNQFLFSSADVILESDHAKTKRYSPFHIDRTDSNQRYVSYLKDYLVLPILLGRKRCLVSHCQPAVEWYVQKINFLIDVTTGEIKDQLAIAYRDDVRSAGYPCELYYVQSGVLGCLVVTGRQTSLQAQKISKNFASPYVQIRPDFNSLSCSVPLPLSLNKEGDLCTFYATTGDDRSVLERLTSQLSKPLENQTVNISDTTIQALHPPVITDWIVEKSFRDHLILVVGNDPVLLRLVGLALFSNFRDGEYAVIDQKTIAQILGKSLGKTATLSHFLDKLHKLVPIKTRKHSWLFRRATSFKIAKPERFMIDMAKCIEYPKKVPVMLSDGGKGEMLTAKVDTRETAYPNPVTNELLHYLNNLPVNTFTTRTNKHLDEMIANANMLDEESRDKTLKMLASIQTNPKPMYRFAPHTSRIYAVGGHFQLLKREIRNIAFSDCIKLDLTYSQLAISSRLFQCAEMIKLCESGNVWTHIQNITGLEKKQIKSYIYSLLFQDDDDYRKKTNNQYIEIEQRLLKSPDFRSYYDSRKLFLKSNLNNMYTDCFNNLLIGEKNNKLSALLQSYELLLLKPALDYFYNIKDNRTKIVLYLFDGFFLSGSKRECLNIANRMVNIVNKNAIELQIPTKLCIELPQTNNN